MEMKTYTNTIKFGKIAYTGSIKRNLVEVDLGLVLRDGRDGKPQAVFTASAGVWNHLHTDMYVAGQCLDDIWEEYASQLAMPSTYKEILRLWKRWHLNDLHAGCTHQRAMGWEREGYDKHPSEPCPKCGYKFGSAWQYEAISTNDLQSIMGLIGIDSLEQVRIKRLLA